MNNCAIHLSNLEAEVAKEVIVNNKNVDEEFFTNKINTIKDFFIHHYDEHSNYCVVC